MYKKIVSPFLFLFDPESIHNFTFTLLKLSFKFPLTKYIVSFLLSLENPKLEKQLFGLNFKNPIGVAAGLDKNAAHISEFSSFGFGFIEIGTITPEPQIGNPKKRLFRLEKDNAIINRMGFNNQGIEKILPRLKNNFDVIIGGNIGKNKSTPNSEAKSDYLKCFKKLYNECIKISKNHPIMIAEFGSPEFNFKDQNKALWIKDAFYKIKNEYPLIKSVTWFQINKELDWRVNSSKESLIEFKKAISDSYFY